MIKCKKSNKNVHFILLRKIWSKCKVLEKNRKYAILNNRETNIEMPEYDLFRKNFSNEKLLNSLKDSFISKISGEYSDLSPNLLINDYEHEKK